MLDIDFILFPTKNTNKRNSKFNYINKKTTKSRKIIFTITLFRHHLKNKINSNSKLLQFKKKYSQIGIKTFSYKTKT